MNSKKITMLSDIGVNLNSRRYSSNRDKVLEDAYNENIEVIITITNSLKDLKSNIYYCKKYCNKQNTPNVYCTIGVHPHNAKELKDSNFRSHDYTLYNILYNLS